MLRLPFLVTIFMFVTQHAQGDSYQHDYWGVAETTTRFAVDFLIEIGLVEILETPLLLISIWFGVVYLGVLRDLSANSRALTGAKGDALRLKPEEREKKLNEERLLMDAAFAWYNEKSLEEFRAMDGYQKFNDQSNVDPIQRLKKKRSEILATLRQGTLAILILLLIQHYFYWS